MASENGLNGVQPPEKPMPSYALATRSVHADDHMAKTTDVSPAIHVSTTFHYSNDPSQLKPEAEDEVYDSSWFITDALMKANDTSSHPSMLPQRLTLMSTHAYQHRMPHALKSSSRPSYMATP